MPADWFIVKPDRELGPYTGAQMKQLAASGQLHPSHLVRRADRSEPIRAAQVRGLFDEINHATDPPASAPPPLPSEVQLAQPKGAAEPPPLPDGGASKPSLHKRIEVVKDVSRAAARLAAAEARRTQLKTVTLPAAYLALGRDVERGGRFRAEHAEIYGEIDRIRSEIARLTASDRREPATNLTERAGRTAKAASDAVQAKALGLKLKAAQRKLGEAVHPIHGAESAEPTLVQPIDDALTELATIEAKLAQEEESQRGRLVTPRRVLYATAGTIVLGVCLFASSRRNTPETPSTPPPSATPARVLASDESSQSLSETSSTKQPGSRNATVATIPNSIVFGSSADAQIVDATERQPNTERQGGPPYVLDPAECPKIHVYSDKLRLEPKGRLWEQRLEYGGLSFSPDGRILAAAGTLRQGFVNWFGAVLVVDAATGKTITAMKELHERQIDSVCFSPDGKIMATGSAGIAKAWSFDPPGAKGDFTFGRQNVPKADECYHYISSLVFTRDGKALIAAGGMDSNPQKSGTLTAWSYPERTQLYTIPTDSRLYSSSVSSDGATLATGSAAGRIDLWDCATGRKKQQSINLSGDPEDEPAALVRFVPSSDRIITGQQVTHPIFDDQHLSYQLRATGQNP